MLRGRRTEAEQLLHSAWRMSVRAADSPVPAMVAQRLALHDVGRLRGSDVVEWTRRAVALGALDDAVRDSTANAAVASSSRPDTPNRSLIGTCTPVP
jgi:hypothetical protein